jgi:hypothetical protein
MNEEYGDLYLKFPDDASASEALEGYEGSIDVIGPIDGVEGWHVNTRGPMPDHLQQYAVIPTNPRRVWA